MKSSILQTLGQSITFIQDGSCFEYKGRDYMKADYDIEAMKRHVSTPVVALSTGTISFLPWDTTVTPLVQIQDPVFKVDFTEEK